MSRERWSCSDSGRLQSLAAPHRPRRNDRPRRKSPKFRSGRTAAENRQPRLGAGPKVRRCHLGRGVAPPLVAGPSGVEKRIPWPPVSASPKASVEKDDVAVGSGLTAPAEIDPSGRKPPELLGPASVGSGTIGGPSAAGGASAWCWGLPAWARRSRTASANMAAMLPGRMLQPGPRPGQPRQARRRRRQLSAGDPAQARLRGGVRQPGRRSHRHGTARRRPQRLPASPFAPSQGPQAAQVPGQCSFQDGEAR